LGYADHQANFLGGQRVTLFLNAVVAGIAVGSIYAIVGIGYTVIFSATRVFNLAQGDLVMVGVMSSYYVLVVLEWPQWVAAVLVVIFVAGVALLEERFVVRRFLQKQGVASFGWFIATLGFSLVIQTVVSVLFGRHPIVSIPSPFALSGLHLGDLTLGYRQIFVIVSFVAIIIALELFYERTWIGQAMRGTAEDRAAASLLGINPVVASRVAFGLAGAVAGFAGYAIAPITFSDPSVGLAFTLKGFLALAIGGFGSIRGAIVGGLLLGVSEQLWELYWGSTYSALTGIILVLAVLTARPQGLFNSAAGRTV
jgi:branched-chain amino acid transport system permease protein